MQFAKCFNLIDKKRNVQKIDSGPDKIVNKYDIPTLSIMFLHAYYTRVKET